LFFFAVNSISVIASLVFLTDLS